MCNNIRSSVMRFTDNCAEIGRELLAWFRRPWQVTWLAA